jgi:hypothetical protein
LEIQVLVWDRHKHMVGLNRLMDLQPQYIYKQTIKKTCTYLLQSRGVYKILLYIFIKQRHVQTF